MVLHRKVMQSRTFCENQILVQALVLMYVCICIGTSAVIEVCRKQKIKFKLAEIVGNLVNIAIDFVFTLSYGPNYDICQKLYNNPDNELFLFNMFCELLS